MNHDLQRILKLFSSVSSTLLDWYKQMPDYQPHPSLAWHDATVEEELEAYIERLNKNYPFYHPRYMAQMLKPPHPVALLSYIVALFYNTNNHALDGGPIPSEMEKEVMQDLLALIDWKEGLGHLTSSGTIANLEGLWVARELHPETIILASEHAHYTHERMAHLLRVRFESLPVDNSGRLDVTALEDRLKQINSHATVVLTLGTTGLGAVDPIHEVLTFRDRYPLRIHVDGAYGGFYRILQNVTNLDLPREPLLSASGADSFVVDPHKHGLQPYGCGSIMFRDPKVGVLYKHDSPYTYFTSDELHLGEISLECSRAGSAAAALWFTLRLFPLSESGFGQILSACRRAALKGYQALKQSPIFHPVVKPELDILGFFPAKDDRSLSASAISRNSRMAFRLLMKMHPPIFVSLLKVKTAWLKRKYPSLMDDEPETTVLRTVLMKPEHEDHIEEMIGEMEQYLQKNLFRS